MYLLEVRRRLDIIPVLLGEDVKGLFLLPLLPLVQLLVLAHGHGSAVLHENKTESDCGRLTAIQ